MTFRILWAIVLLYSITPQKIPVGMLILIGSELNINN
jgi:hypothetical protein